MSRNTRIKFILVVLTISLVAFLTIGLTLTVKEDQRREQLAFEFFQAQNPGSKVTFEQWKANVEVTKSKVTVIPMPHLSVPAR